MSINTCLNCDSVFDVLTRGPYPDGESIAEVDQHIATCHECRRLAEALRPATNLFHEVIAQEETDNLPVYRCRIPDAKTQPVSLTQQVANPTGRWFTQPAIVALAGLFLIGCLAGMGIQKLRNHNTIAIDFGSSGSRLVYQLSTIDELNRFPVPDKCERKVAFTKHPTSSDPDSSESLFDCCTTCHQSTRTNWDRRSPKPGTAMIAATCLACHQNAAIETQNNQSLNRTSLLVPKNTPEEIEGMLIRRRLDAGGFPDSIQTVTTQFKLFTQTA